MTAASGDGAHPAEREGHHNSAGDDAENAAEASGEAGIRARPCARASRPAIAARDRV